MADKLKYYSVSTILHLQVGITLLFQVIDHVLSGRLSVELLKGSHFRNLTSQKAPDTFVTLTLLDGNCKVLLV